MLQSFTLCKSAAKPKGTEGLYIPAIRMNEVFLAATSRPATWGGTLQRWQNLGDVDRTVCHKGR